MKSVYEEWNQIDVAREEAKKKLTKLDKNRTKTKNNAPKKIIKFR
jgi:hypothetical protein